METEMAPNPRDPPFHCDKGRRLLQGGAGGIGSVKAAAENPPSENYTFKRQLKDWFQPPTKLSKSMVAFVAGKCTIFWYLELGIIQRDDGDVDVPTGDN